MKPEKKQQPTPANLFFNRELSWLEFNRRVLAQALDSRNPLLERLKFLSIFTANLDEFIMKRLGGLQRQLAAGVVTKSIDGLTPSAQIAAIRKTILPLFVQQAECFKNEILPQLQNAGIHLLSYNDLTNAEKKEAAEYYRTTVFPVLTPLAVDRGHPFPLISNLSLSLAFIIAHPDTRERLFARVKIPEVIPRWVQLAPAANNRIYRFANLVEIIRHNAKTLFPGMEIIDTTLFRITRNVDIEQDDEDAEDLLELIAQNLRQRRFANVVRLEYEPQPDREMLNFLLDEFQLTAQDIYEMPGPLDYTDLRQIAELPLAEHHFEPHTPQIPPAFSDQEADIFSTLRKRDLLVHHPYESFDATVERFIRTAADDPRVLAIKMTLYRTGDESPFIKTLIRAAESGKQVVCMVELQARFDEQRNISCAQKLENAGVHVVYGIAGLKTHTKTTLIVRKDPDGIFRSYVHLGTGNYHVDNARIYTDLGLFTADQTITADVVELFHYITGRSLKKDYLKLLVAPVNMRTRFLELIQHEIENHQQGKPAHIIAKMNALEDRTIIHALYRASQAGVPIDLIVRGFCCLKPGVPELSENIRVVSVIGRFFEHARIFHFRNAATEPHAGKFFLGSADWMYRNQTRRVEAVTPIENPELRQRLYNILQIQLHDKCQAWHLQPDGTYRLPHATTNREKCPGSHQTLIQATRTRHAQESNH